jgi:hypothetical protein
MGTFFRLPKRLVEGNNIDEQAELVIKDGMGVYVTLTRLDTGKYVELPEEGAGAPEDTDRIVKYARRNRRSYVVGRVEDALRDEWQREQLGLGDPA